MSIKIFLVYAQEDSDLCNKLKTFLEPLVRNKRVKVRDQSDISPGQDRAEMIENWRNHADIILLLLSPDALRSPFYDDEIQPALVLRRKDRKWIIPLLIRSVFLENDELLKGLQVLPRDEIPVSSAPDQDEAWKQVVQELVEVTERIAQRRTVGARVAHEGSGEAGSAIMHIDEPGLSALIPPTNPRTIGQREKTVRDIYTQLTQPGISALILTGMDGTGKSTLARLVCEYVRQQNTQESFFKAPPIWLPITPTFQMKTLAAQLYQKLRLTPPNLTGYSPKRLAEQLFWTLNDAQRPPQLIVLDQFDNLLDSRTRRVLDDHPGFQEWFIALNERECQSRFLITSRHLPHLPNNFTFSSIQQYSLDDIDMAEALDILHKRGINLAEDDVQKVIHYCGRSVYALARLPVANVQNILRDPQRFQSWKYNVARELISPMYQQLDELSRHILRAFAIYREPVLAKAARIVLQRHIKLTTDQYREVLAGLVAQDLLHDSGELFQVQTVVQTYLQEATDPEFNLQSAHERAAHYYLQQADSSFNGSAQLRALRDERYLVEAVWHLCQARKWTAAYRHLFGHDLYEQLKLRGENATLLSLISSFLPTEKWHPRRDLAANIHSSLGIVCTLLGKKNDALGHFKDALEIAEALADRPLQGVLKREIGRVYNALGNKKIALSFFQEALTILQEGGKQLDIAETYVRLGRVYSVTGQQEQARQAHERALQIYRAESSASGEGMALSYLGRVHSLLGDARSGLELCWQGVQILQRTGDRRGEDRALDNLGHIYSALEQYDDARMAYEKALRIAQEIGDRGGEGIIYHGLAEAYVGMGKNELAQKTFAEALDALVEVGDEWREGIVRGSLAEFYAAAGEKSKALHYYQQAINIQDKHENAYGKGKTFYSFGLFYLRQPTGETRQQADEIALASFLAANQELAGEPIPLEEQAKVQQEIEKLQQRLGEEAFADLQARVGDQPLRIVMRKVDALAPSPC